MKKEEWRVSNGACNDTICFGENYYPTRLNFSALLTNAIHLIPGYGINTVLNTFIHI